jgi:hypothetical protein
MKMDLFLIFKYMMRLIFLLNLINSAEQIIEIMESAVTLKVPNKVDYEKGDNWGDINIMSYLNVNIPPIYCNVRKEYLYDFTQTSW